MVINLYSMHYLAGITIYNCNNQFFGFLVNLEICVTSALHFNKTSKRYFSARVSDRYLPAGRGVPILLEIIYVYYIGST